MDAKTVIENLPLTLTMDDVRRHLHVSRPTVYKWVSEGRLHRVDIPGRFLVSAESVLRFVYGDEPTDISADTPDGN